ncbi:MAG: CDP-diacylglycerol--serine O-phosphatidyltransferase [Deltaproteobacteria bacterium]|nr:CDP-diacylglycerol--serine O-phosphatidyltransferase [Deltaproteobacteria bacterium]
MRKLNKFKKAHVRRSIYVLPNIFTTFNLFAGFFAIISSIESKFTIAAVSILIAGVFDLLDGKIARATNTSSQFGIEYDSLADLVSFGIAPMLLMYLWALKPLGRFGWLAAFLFMACGALRLARYNTNAGAADNGYFTGLPIPAAAGMTASIVLFADKINIAANSLLMLTVLYLLSFLMVSSIKFQSLKKYAFFGKMKFNIFAAGILILIFIAAMPQIALFVLSVLYILSGLFLNLKNKLFKNKLKTKKTEQSVKGI